MNLQDFGERLRVERVRLGATQDEMAVKLNVSKRSYCAYEAGETAPSAKLIAALAEVEGVALDYLLTGKTLQERAAQAAAGMPARLRALREEHGLEAILKAAGVTAKQWQVFEESLGAPQMPSGTAQRLIDAFNLDPMQFITGQIETLTTARTEETRLLKNYRACSPPDQEAIRHHAQFLASRNTPPVAGGLKPVDEAHQATAAGERDTKVARALAKAWDKGGGVAVTPAKAEPAGAAKKAASRSSDRAKG